MGRLRKLAAVLAAGALVASGAVLLDSAPASAAKVGNPGNGFTFKLASGALNVGGTGFEFVDEGRQPQCSDGSNNSDDDQDTAIDYPADPQCTSAADDSETQGGFQAKAPIQLNNGTIDAAGNITWTAGNVSFPAQYLYVAAGDASGGIVDDFIVTLQISATSSWTGHINPITGAMDLSAHVKVSATGGPLDSSCAVSPIDINGMVTGTSTGPGPKPPLTGSSYDPNTARATLVNTSYSVPGASGCGTVALVYNLNNAINDQLGLPSPAGNNDATFTGIFTPNIPQPGVVATFTATPSSGPAPLAVTFSSAGSTAGSTYQWDFDGNGTFDASGATASTTYSTAGTRTVKLRVTNGSDFAETTRTVTVGPNQPPIANDGSLTVAEDGSGSVNVTATDPEGGAVTYARTAPNPAHGTSTCTSAGS
jgi:PKD repeat protein